MKVRFFANSYPFIVKLIFDIIIMLASFFVFYLLPVLLINKFLDVNLLDFFSLINTPYLLLLDLAWYSLSFFFVPSILIAYFFGKPKDYLKLKYNLNTVQLFAIFILFIVVQVVVNFLAKYNMAIKFPDELQKFIEAKENLPNELFEKLLYTTDVKLLLVNILVVGFIPALSEEFFFRGVIQSQLHKAIKNYHIAIAIAAFIFAFFHFQFLTFLPRFFLGLILGYLFYFTKSIWANVIFHFLNNSFACLAYFYLAKHNLPTDFIQNPYALNFSVWSLIVSLIVVFITLKIIKSYMPVWER